MKPSRAWWLIPAALVWSTARAATNTPLNSAIGVSRQITTYAPGHTLPAAICVFAEELKQKWLDQLNLSDSWRDPIVVVVREAALTNTVPAPINLRITQIGPIVKYEISTAVPPAIEKRALAAVIVRALCLEYANRKHPSGNVTNWQSATVPLWLAHGLSESIRGKSEWLIPDALRAANSARPPSVSDVMDVAVLPPDEPSRELFAANAWLLTESLLRLPAGTRRMEHLLGELAWTKSFTDAFWMVYRDVFTDAVGLEKWWILQQARLTTIVVPQNMTATATTKKLDQLLIYPYGYPFDSLERVAEEKWLQTTLVGRILELRALYAVCHPLYRPAIQSYLEAAELLAAEKFSRYRRAVRQAEQERATADQRVRAIHEVLDHAENAYCAGLSTNLLQGYFRTLEQADKFEQQRRNPISDYLDQFEK